MPNKSPESIVHHSTDKREAKITCSNDHKFQKWWEGFYIHEIYWFLGQEFLEPSWFLTQMKVGSEVTTVILPSME